MFKKIISCALSATLIFGINMSLLTASADDAVDETTQNYVYGDRMTAFDFVKSKRSILAEDGEYNIDDCKSIREYLLRRSDGEKFYSKKVAVSFDCEGLSTENYADPSVIDTKIVYVGSTIKIPSHSLTMEGHSHGGWWYDGKNYIVGESFTVPDENVVFTPYWFKYHILTYDAGDYDDIVGQKIATVNVTEGTGFDLADSSRFSRRGYILSGWECSLDGKIYGPNERYIIPESDITFKAVWKPSLVTISITANNGNSKDKISDSEYTGNEYQLPECTFTNGDKTFSGWMYKGDIYQPGESITIPALLKGEKIVISAQWE